MESCTVPSLTHQAPSPWFHVQVQDVGLIFLSAVATSVVHIGKEAGIKDEEILGTTLVTLLIITFAVGILIILTGEKPHGCSVSGNSPGSVCI